MGSSSEPHGSFQEAIRYAGDLDRRLDGEDPRTTYPEDAEHWEQVYRELSAFKEEVLTTAAESGSGVEPAGQAEVSNDLTLLRAELARLRGRREFWARRRRELEGTSG